MQGSQCLSARPYGDWLSRDYEAPTNFVGYPGRLDFASDRVLVCAVGYEAERALKVIEAVELSRVILLVGTKPTRKVFYEKNNAAVREVMGSSNYKILDIDVSSPQKSMDTFREIAQKLPKDMTLHFAPFSTKNTCIAIWGLWLEADHIRVWNAQPAVYNVLDFSKGSLLALYFGVKWSES